MHIRLRCRLVNDVMALTNDNKGSSETTHAVREFAVEHKTIRAAVKENHRGKFLRITEDTRGRRSSVIVPSEGVQTFIDFLQELAPLAAPE